MEGEIFYRKKRAEYQFYFMKKCLVLSAMTIILIREVKNVRGVTIFYKSPAPPNLAYKSAPGHRQDTEGAAEHATEAGRVAPLVASRSLRSRVVPSGARGVGVRMRVPGDRLLGPISAATRPRGRFSRGRARHSCHRSAPTGSRWRRLLSTCRLVRPGKARIRVNTPRWMDRGFGGKCRSAPFHLSTDRRERYTSHPSHKLGRKRRRFVRDTVANESCDYAP